MLGGFERHGGVWGGVWMRLLPCDTAEKPVLEREGGGHLHGLWEYYTARGLFSTTERETIAILLLVFPPLLIQDK